MRKLTTLLILTVLVPLINASFSFFIHLRIHTYLQEFMFANIHVLFSIDNITNVLRESYDRLIQLR